MQLFTAYFIVRITIRLINVHYILARLLCKRSRRPIILSNSLAPPPPTFAAFVTAAAATIFRWFIFRRFFVEQIIRELNLIQNTEFISIFFLYRVTGLACVCVKEIIFIFFFSFAERILRATPANNNRTTERFKTDWWWRAKDFRLKAVGRRDATRATHHEN